MNVKIIRDFSCHGKHMVIVKLEQSVHAMSYNEWKSLYGKLYPERWNRNRFARKTA